MHFGVVMSAINEVPTTLVTWPDFVLDFGPHIEWLNLILEN